FTEQAVAESQARRPGGGAMLARMSEMMFVDAVRRHAERLPADSRGWLAGLRDRFVGRAPALLPERPAHAGALDELGGAAGLARAGRRRGPARRLRAPRAPAAAIALDVGYDSEAAFARAFKRLGGKPPAAWR